MRGPSLSARLWCPAIIFCQRQFHNHIGRTIDTGSEDARRISVPHYGNVEVCLRLGLFRSAQASLYVPPPLAQLQQLLFRNRNLTVELVGFRLERGSVLAVGSRLSLAHGTPLLGFRTTTYKTFQSPGYCLFCIPLCTLRSSHTMAYLGGVPRSGRPGSRARSAVVPQFAHVNFRRWWWIAALA